MKEMGDMTCEQRLLIENVRGTSAGSTSRSRRLISILSSLNF